MATELKDARKISYVFAAIFVFISIVLVVALTLQAVSDDAKAKHTRSSAAEVEKWAKVYNHDKGVYPSYADMKAGLKSHGSPIVLGEQGKSKSEDVIYLPCNGKGAVLWAWNPMTEMYESTLLGNTDACQWN